MLTLLGASLLCLVFQLLSVTQTRCSIKLPSNYEKYTNNSRASTAIARGKSLALAPLENGGGERAELRPGITKELLDQHWALYGGPTYIQEGKFMFAHQYNFHLQSHLFCLD